MLYTTDASVFEIYPQKIHVPKTKDDLIAQLRQAFLAGESVTMRGGGTSLAGQAIGAGTIIDVSKHLTDLIEYRPNQLQVKVQPGLVVDELNQRLAFDDLYFPVDISTSNRATIGGMIGNNSAGSYSVYYGTMRDWVESLDVVLADGSQACLAPLDSAELNEKMALDTLEGDIYRQVVSLVKTHCQAIIQNAPDASLIRRNTGYALDVLARDYQPFNPKGKPFNLAPLICGSEGSLCVITAATLKLTAKPQHRQLICGHFDSIEKALALVPSLLASKPAAIELIDQATLACTAHNVEQQANRFWVEGNPAAVLVLELFASSAQSLKKQANDNQAWLLEQGAYAAPMIANSQSNRVWALRKAGLGLLMGKRTRKKAVAVIEDASVPVSALPDFYAAVQAMLADNQVNAVFYGHASVGLIHIRPELDLAEAEDRQLFSDIAQKFSAIVKQFHGALSGEHGDGRLRAPFLREQVGDEVYQVWQQIKSVLDPNNQLNPGVILSDQPVTQSWRADRQPQKKLDAGFDWRGDISLIDAVEKCNGAAACRKTTGNMCPSYQVTREEAYSTRGRSNLLRWALTEPDPLAALGISQLQDALSHCLSCRACKVECPASVDMARLKAEVAYQLKPTKIMNWLLSRQDKVMAWSQKHPKPSGWLQNLGVSRKTLGIDPRRPLPKMGAFTLYDWWQAQTFVSEEAAQKTVQKVWVLVDLYSQYQEPDVGKAMIQSLVKLGFDVRPVFMKASPRTLISHGLLKEAASELSRIIGCLSNVALDDYIVGIEPSETLTWRDEAKDLLPKKADAFNYSQVMLYEELLVDMIKQQRFPPISPVDKKLWLQVHCHQKALAKTEDIHKILAQVPGLVVNTINTGCCGMAGDFGYKNYDMSVKIAQQALLPALEKSTEDDWIVATGISCRQQVSDLAERQAMHLAELIDQLIP